MGNITKENALGTFTKAVQSLVRIKPEVDMFFKSFFREEVSAKKGTSFEIVRSGRKVFNDVGMNGEPTITSFDKSSEKIFVPGFWDIAVQSDAYDAFNRMVGESDRMPEATFISLVEETAQQVQLNLDAMERKEELMAAQVMDTGIVTLKNGDNIDYKRRAESLIDYAAGNNFASDTVDPGKVLFDMAEVMINYGMVSGGEVFNAVMGDEAFAAFQANANIVEKADNRRYENIMTMNQGERIGTGAVPQGMYKFGGLQFNIWSYGGRYEDPDNSNATTKFLNTKKVVLLPNDKDFVYFYGGTKSWSAPIGTAGRYPGIIKAKRNFYEAEDELRVSKLYGFRTRPLPIPREVDRIVTAQVIAS